MLFCTAEKDIRKSKLSSDFTPQESGRSGAQINLVKQNEEVRHTIQSERRPSITTSSTVSPRKMVVTVDVLADSEVNGKYISLIVITAVLHHTLIFTPRIDKITVLMHNTLIFIPRIENR